MRRVSVQAHDAHDSIIENGCGLLSPGMVKKPIIVVVAWEIETRGLGCSSLGHHTTCRTSAFLAACGRCLYIRIR